MAEHHHVRPWIMVQYEETQEDACMDAFVRGNKRKAVRQLLLITQPTDVRSLIHHGTGASLLHCAAYHGWQDVVCELTNRYSCDVNYRDSRGQTALHYAASGGHLELVTYLITEQHCQPTLQDNDGWTPLHCACTTVDHLNIAKYLIMELNCDPSCTNKDGDTPLHLACRHGHAHIVQFLLSTGSVEPNSKNKDGYTPLDIASLAIDGNSYEVLRVFQQYQQCRKEFPVHLFSKAMLTGNSAAGKSSLAQVITRIATRSSMASVLDKVIGYQVEVECLTAGIIPLHIESKEVGNMVLYDIAGHSEFYSSHFAVMESAMQRSAAIFINLVDLSKTEGEITREVHYWLNFMENASCKVEEKSCVVMVGSHADMLNQAQLESKSTLVTELVQRRMKKLEYMGFVALDCRQAESTGARQFVSLLSKSQQTVAAHAPVMGFCCHLLYAFVRSKLKRTACKLQDLISILAAENDSSIPRDMHVLSGHLISLSDKGLIMFLKNHQHLERSWVVVEKKALLKEVNGTLFSPRKFKQHRQIASNTGIVPVSSLAQLFPQHEVEMLVGFLESLKICHPVNLLDIITNLKATIPASLPSCVGSEALLFFPSLVQVERPDMVISGEQLSFGWCLGCKDPYQFFTPRFLHVLLLSLAYTYPLASRNIPASSPLHGLERKCFVWKNGISWSDEDDIRTVVELIGQNQWVVVAMSHSKDRPAEHATLCSALIGLVVHLQQEHCPSVDTCECLISPSLVQQYPFNKLPDMDLFAIEDVARSILLHKPSVRSYKDGSGRLPTKMLSSEPYYQLSPSSVCQLLDSTTAKNPVPAPLLQEVRRHCQQPQWNPGDHKNLRACVDKMSIFSGRNPLEIAGLSCDDVLSQVAGAGCAPTVQLLLSAVRSVSDWHQLGVRLGLEMSQLHEIEQNYHVGGVSRMKTEMLSLWLRCTPGASWVELVTALEAMDENVLARHVAVSYCGRSLTTGTVPLETRATVSCAASGVSSSGVEECRSHSTVDRSEGENDDSCQPSV